MEKRRRRSRRVNTFWRIGIVEVIGEAAVMELIAEECVEMAQAAQKIARAMRGDNPTEKPVEYYHGQLMEEWADVLVCSEYLDELPWFNPAEVAHNIRFKKQRTKERLN